MSTPRSTPYQPGLVPLDFKLIPAFLQQELLNLSAAINPLLDGLNADGLHTHSDDSLEESLAFFLGDD